jgi:hypothetical protein
MLGDFMLLLKVQKMEYLRLAKFVKLSYSSWTIFDLSLTK